jgi:hypothetical protein
LLGGPIPPRQQNERSPTKAAKAHQGNAELFPGTFGRTEIYCRVGHYLKRERPARRLFQRIRVGPEDNKLVKIEKLRHFPRALWKSKLGQLFQRFVPKNQSRAYFYF